MTDFNKWEKYDANSELNDLAEKEAHEALLRPFTNMVKEMTNQSVEVQKDLSKFAKSMKSLVCYWYYCYISMIFNIILGECCKVETKIKAKF